MEKQQFLNKLEELKSPANAERWAVLQLWLVEAKSDGEIAKALDKDRSTATRKIIEICKHFGTVAKGKKDQRQHLVLLFRKYCKDFEVHPSIYPDWVDGDLSDRPLTQTKQIVTENIQECRSLDFIGRDKAISDLDNLIARGARLVLIKGEGGIGKTTLAEHYLDLKGFDILIKANMAKESQNITSVKAVVEEWLSRYFYENPSQEFGLNLDRLKEKLCDPSKNIGILIDNLEPALQNGKLIEPHSLYSELFRVLADPSVRSTTLITSREPLYASGITPYNLGNLQKEAWQQYFTYWNIDIGDNPIEEDSAFSQMYKAYGGNAESMCISRGAIVNPEDEYQGSLESYWQRNHKDLLIEPRIENLVKQQFHKLDSDHPQAYKLLCRMGCFRYQDVPTIPNTGLCAFLWDVPEEKHDRIIRALSDRQLIKVSKEGFYLHPVTRAESIARLKSSQEWEEANQKAAEFWTKSIRDINTPLAALQVFEACYHYLAINQLTLAGNVLIEVRDDGSKGYEELWMSLARFGFGEKYVSIIPLIIEHIEIGYLPVRLYIMLGFFCRARGNRKALLYQKKAMELANEFLDSQPEIEQERKVRLCQIESLSIILTYKQIKYDLEGILNIYQQMQELIENFDEDRYRQKAESYLWLLMADYYYDVEDFSKSLFFADKLYDLFANTKILGSYIIGTLKTLFQIYLKQGEAQKADECYQKIIFLDQDYSHNYMSDSLLFCKALFYRVGKDFQISISYYQQLLERNSKRGSIFAIALNCFDLALIYQEINDIEKCIEYRDRAIQLFTEFGAPKRAEKVMKALGGNMS